MTNEGRVPFFFTMQLTRQQLLIDLRQAYYDARRHKRNRHYQRVFEARLEENLSDLCDKLNNRNYHASPSTCFLVKDPKLREVFAAQFRDRIVHHLYYNYTHRMLERTFIADSYSCIKGRGTHYGIDRLAHHIRQVSENWQSPCYVLKMDIKGYFMHINRARLLQITLRQLRRLSQRCISKGNPYHWDDCLDIGFVEWLSREIILLDPTDGCRVLGKPEDWRDLSHDKSLFHSPQGCGLPIGNLTSQLFSNVYLNELDQYMKRGLGCRHYGRYVDDFYIVSNDKEWLRGLIPPVRRFLREKLSLQLHEGKVRMYDARSGVDFLGGFIKPYRNYISNATLHRMEKKQPSLQDEDPVRLDSRINSLLGVLSHYSSLKLQRRLFHPLSQQRDTGSLVFDGRKYKWCSYCSNK
ncbi:MAG: RNA-directed DNA polymerase [Muribaculaceae bacterium]|nr:RNA-directed DNA polymerase [Muribaculaceae bacterium]